VDVQTERNMQPGEFITSDTHFTHTNIIKYCNRPFSSAENMDEEMIRRWNAKVTNKNAIVYHCGDLGCNGKPDRLRWIIGRLNGRIRLLLGNHDSWLLKEKHSDLRSLFDEFCPYAFRETKTPTDITITMCHFAMVVWNKSHRGTGAMLHGHSHGSLPKLQGPLGNLIRIDVGVDCHPNYEPFSYHEILAEIKKRS
jgi:calcineurin-like phosphoesterase family protein